MSQRNLSESMLRQFSSIFFFLSRSCVLSRLDELKAIFVPPNPKEERGKKSLDESFSGTHLNVTTFDELLESDTPVPLQKYRNSMAKRLKRLHEQMEKGSLPAVIQQGLFLLNDEMVRKFIGVVEEIGEEHCENPR